MGNEIQLISDGDGLMVLGDASDVDRFLASSDVDQDSTREIELTGLWSVLATAGALAHVGGEFSANSGRWVKLTKGSAEAVRRAGELMPTKTPGVSHAMIGQPGKIGQWLQIEQGPSLLLAGPMILPALATMMQQRAMQEQMDAIAEYLTVIDEKVDDVLRAQKDGVLADMIGVDLVIEEAMTVRASVGHVSEVTWSKLQSASMTIGRTQAYAVLQLGALAEKLEKKVDLGDVAKATREVQPRVREWMAVIARCVQLQDAVAVLELDRVLDSALGELDSHRIGLRNAREKRLGVIADATTRLLIRMDESVRTANAKVLLNPFDAPAVVRASNQVAAGVLDFRGRLGIESEREATDPRRWGHAAGEMRDRILRAGSDTVDRASQPFRKIDIDGDGVPDRPRAAAAADEAGAALKGAAAGLSNAFGTMFQRRRSSGEVEAPQTDVPRPNRS